MGISIFTSDQYVTFEEFAAFVVNARRYIDINACVWKPAQQSILFAFISDLINRLENINPVDPNLPWGSPGGGWAASSTVQDYFNRVRDAVPKSHYFRDTYPYTINPFNPNTPIPGYPTGRSIALLFQMVAFFWGCYLSNDNAQEFLDKSDYTTYIYSDNLANVSFGSVRTLVSGLSRIHFAGKEVTLPPNRLVILQDPAFLLTGRLVQFPQTRSDKCCEVIAQNCIQRVNCGVYVTKFVRDVICDITCQDPCRKCNLANCPGSCYGEGGGVQTRYESEFAPEGRDSLAAGDAGNEREFRETFITIRPFVNSDLLIPQLTTRLGRFGEYPWDLGLPDEFLTNREIDERIIRENNNPAFDREIEPGGRGKRTHWVPCNCGGGINALGQYEGGTRGGGCRKCGGGRYAGNNNNEIDTNNYGAKGGHFKEKEKSIGGFRIATELFDDNVPLSEFDGICPRGKCRGRCVCRVSGFEAPKLAIPVNRIRYIRPRTIFGLLEYMVEKLEWIGSRVRVNSARDNYLNL